MMKEDGGSRSLVNAALKDKNFETPQPVSGEWSFMIDAVLAVKEDAEEELKKEFYNFQAVSFIKRDFHYVIRVEVDNGCIDIYWRGNVLEAVKGGINLNDEMSFNR